MLLQFIGNNKKFSVPLLAEALYEGFFEELIGADAFAAAFDESAAAHIPLVEVHCC